MHSARACLYAYTHGACEPLSPFTLTGAGEAGLATYGAYAWPSLIRKSSQSCAPVATTPVGICIFSIGWDPRPPDIASAAYPILDAASIAVASIARPSPPGVGFGCEKNK